MYDTVTELSREVKKRKGVIGLGACLLRVAAVCLFILLAAPPVRGEPSSVVSRPASGYQPFVRSQVPLSSLPQDAAPVNPPDSFYLTYKSFVWTTASAVFVLAGLAILLGIVIVRRKRVEVALRESENKFRDLTEKSVVGTYLVQDGKVAYANARFAETFGYPLEEIIGTVQVKSLIFPEDWPAVEENLRKRVSGELGALHSEFRIVTRDGGIKHAEAYSSRTTYQGQPAVIGTLLDITERKRAEQAVTESEHSLQAILAASPVGIGKVRNGVILWANEALCRISGYTQEELQGQDISFLYENAQEHGRVTEVLNQEGQAEGRMRKKDGTVRTVFIQISPADNSSNIFAIADITKQKEAEGVLRFTQFAVDRARDSILWIDSDARIVYVNNGTCRSMGYTRKELLSLAIPDIDPSYRKEKWEGIWERVEQQGSQLLESVHRRKDGTVFPVEIGLNFLRYEGSEYICAFVRDITERRRTEEELRRLSVAIEQAGEEICITDPEGVIQYINPAFEKITGYSRQEAIGKTPRMLKSGVHDKGFYDQLWETITRGNVWTGQITNRHKDGRLIQEDVTISPLINSAGRLTGYLCIKRDITEEVKIGNQLRQAQKMEAVGTLAGGIAHDFNNILTALIGYGTLLQMKVSSTDPLRAYIDQIVSASRKATNLTASLLAFSRRQPITLTPLDINGCVRKTEQLLKRLLTEDIELNTFLGKDDMVVMADATQVDQILFNLATNARDAMPQGGRLSITTKTVLLDRDFEVVHGFGKTGSYVLLSFSDTGIGMDEPTRQKIFDPFFTTKEEGKGTGLGLSTVYGIVKQHNGYITVYSEPGVGTTFRVYLPAVTARTVEEQPSSFSHRKGKETILVADDNEDARQLMKEVFRLYGYSVIEAVDGEDAIDRFGNHGSIDLVILDSVMPKKNGRAVYDEIVKTRPDTKVLFISGYTKDIILDKGIGEHEFDFVPKPLSPNDLLKKVREMLDREPL
jgi:PAS domain S-box-containing protein